MSDHSDPIDAASALTEAEREHATRNPVHTYRHQLGEAKCRKCKRTNDRYKDGYGTCSDCVEPVHVEEENQARIRDYEP